jgi:rubrerythrin
MSTLEKAATDRQQDERSIESVFTACIQNEMRAYSIYKQFTEFFANEPQICCFWAKLAMEEKLHAKALQNIQKEVSSTQLCELANNHLFQDVQMATSFLNKYRPETVRTLDDAYEVAHEIEFSEVNAVLKLLTCSFISREIRKKALIAQLSNHQDKLSMFSNIFGNKKFRKEIAAQTPL